MHFLRALHRGSQYEVDCDVAQRELVCHGPRSPENCVDTCQKLIEIEWLCQVVVRAEVQASQFVGLLRSCGHNEYGRRAMTTKSTTELEAVDVR